LKCSQSRAAEVATIMLCIYVYYETMKRKLKKKKYSQIHLSWRK
jgi:hypothetical protein